MQHLGNAWYEAHQAAQHPPMPTRWTSTECRASPKRPRQLQRITIDVQPVNPDEDIIPNHNNRSPPGLPIIHVRDTIAYCYKPDGRFVTTVTTVKLHDLWKRFHSAQRKGKHDDVEYVGTFEQELLLLLMRYPVHGKHLKNTERRRVPCPTRGRVGCGERCMGRGPYTPRFAARACGPAALVVCRDTPQGWSEALPRAR